MSDKWRHWRLFGKGLELCANVGTHSEFRSSNHAVVRPGSGVRQRGTGGNEGVAWRGWRGNAASNQFPQCWQIIILFSRFGKSRDLYHDQISIFCLFYLFSLEFIQPITETATIYPIQWLISSHHMESTGWGYPWVLWMLPLYTILWAIQVRLKFASNLYNHFSTLSVLLFISEQLFVCQSAFLFICLFIC